MFFRNLTAVQKGMVLVLVPVFFELVLLATLANTLLNAEQTLKQIDSSRKAVLQLQSYEIAMVTTITTIIDDQETLANQLAAIDKMTVILQSKQRLGSLSESTNPELQTELRQLTKVNGQLLDLMQSFRRIQVDHPLSGPERQEILPTVVVMARVIELQRLCRQVVRIENGVTAAEPEKFDRLRTAWAVAIGTGVFFSFVLSVVMAALFSADILHRLRRINDNAHSLVANATLPPPEGGLDEIAQLESSLYEASLALSDLRRKESAMLDNAADVICSLDEKLRFAGANAAVAKVWLYSPDDMLGMSLVNLLAADEANSTTMAFHQVAAGLGSGVVENRVRSKDGHLKDSLWRVKWSAEDQKFFCVVRDVSALRAMEKLRQQFLSIVCHDLRNPIMSIGIGLEVLAHNEVDPLSEAVQDEVLRIKAGSEELTALTTAFLALEKLESGMSAMNNRMVSLQDVCIVATEALAGLSSEAQVEFELPSGDGMVWGDEERLVEAVSNLLTHAINVSPFGSAVKMEIATTHAMVQLQIHDAGQGIAAEERGLVFERFRQASPKGQNANPNVKEMGFGLAVAKAIIERHQGEVGIKVDGRRGNCLWLQLPEYHEVGGSQS